MFSKVFSIFGGGLVPLLLIFSAASGLAAPQTPGGAANLTVEPQLQRNVAFWVRVYSEFSTEQGIIHDAKYIDHIYEVLDFGRGSRGHLVRESKRRWRAALLGMHRKAERHELDGTAALARLTADERKVYDMYKDVDEPDKYLQAAHRKRLRFQLGQKDRFVAGLRESGRYLALMEEVFRREGLPVELTRLPFVESSFNERARSKVGASGIWQFMRSTGRLYLSVNDAVDERNDPIRATEAAAKLLKGNYDSLHNWPLAITAYNHGRKGMMRAVRRVGSEDLEDVVGSYRSRTFGFASSNFFCELMAAVSVERDADRYFGHVERERPLDYAEAVIPESVNLKELARFMKLDVRRLRELNPGLTELVFKGKRDAPAGFALRVPRAEGIGREETARTFLAGFSQVPAVYKARSKHGSRRGRRTLSTDGD